MPQPELKGEKTEGWLEWLQLFWFGKHANAQLFQQNKSCITFTQPLSSNSKPIFDNLGNEIPTLVEEEILKVGQTYTNLPPAGDVSRYGSYIITGYVKASGDGYIMHMELQTACSRKKVAAADVPFNKSSSSDYTMGIAQQAVSKLSPLIEKLNNLK